MRAQAVLDVAPAPPRSRCRGAAIRRSTGVAGDAERARPRLARRRSRAPPPGGRRGARRARSGSPPRAPRRVDRHAPQQLDARARRGPSPVALDVTSTGPRRRLPTSRSSPSRSRHSAAARSAASGVTRSAFESASMRGSAREPRHRARRARPRSSRGWPTGSEPSSGARSSTWTSRRVRSTCARKSWPRPGAARRALDQPGDVGETSWRSSASSVPSTGSSVVNG